MFVSSHPTYVKVTLTPSEWNLRSRGEKDFLFRNCWQSRWFAGQHEIFFLRKQWRKARHFFPRLKKVLPRTWQNL